MGSKNRKKTDVVFSIRKAFPEIWKASPRC